jgi:diguanylate cyclase (GGDEF)-like protein/PAS domain S-box-containing protein
MELSIAQKLSLLNQTILDSFNLLNIEEIIANFTVEGIKIIGADYGISWYRVQDSENYELAFASPDLPFAPRAPRGSGLRNQVENNQAPYFSSTIDDSIDFSEELSPYVKSFVIIPITYKNNIYGNVVFYSKIPRDFSDEEKSLCSALGNSTAQAITINRLVKSEQKAREQAENQEQRFRTLIENSYDAILLIDPSGKILDASNSVQRITGYLSKELTSLNIIEFVNSDDLDQMQDHMKKTIEAPGVQHKIEFRYKHKEGGWKWMEAIGMSMLDNPSIGAVVVNIRDVTERKESENIIQHQALHDSLTALPNRQQFDVRFDQALEIAKRNDGKLAVMFLDIDRFKNINDALGHGVGDNVLKVVASRFLSCLRNEDTVARFGGDEFLVLVNDVNSPKDVAVVAEKILKAVRVPIQVDDNNLHLTVSIGVAIYPSDGLDKKSLKRNADIALYQAKKNGRNRCQIYENSMEDYASEKFTLENELRQAFLDDQILVYYQPIINLKTDELVSAEALCRWQHPTKGLLLPMEFIPLAEESGLISMLDKYVLKKSCSQIKLWRSFNLPKFRVAVNFSAQQFSEPNFVSNLVEIISECNIEPENLEIEITESLSMSNLELTGANLKELKTLGFKITIDDFGTGYSSLAYLKRFPINSLKIDRSFIRGSIINEQDTSITRTIISMAHNLNLKSVAEGVETKQQLEFLQSLGCDYAQGFYIGHPMPAEKLPDWIEEFKAKKVPTTE